MPHRPMPRWPLSLRSRAPLRRQAAAGPRRRRRSRSPSARSPRSRSSRRAAGLVLRRPAPPEAVSAARPRPPKSAAASPAARPRMRQRVPPRPRLAGGAAGCGGVGRRRAPAADAARDAGARAGRERPRPGRRQFRECSCRAVGFEPTALRAGGRRRGADDPCRERLGPHRRRAGPRRLGLRHLSGRRRPRRLARRGRCRADRGRGCRRARRGIRRRAHGQGAGRQCPRPLELGRQAFALRAASA